MPQAVPLPRDLYVQYLRTPPDAPRRAPVRTTEVKGQKRVGEGQVFRLFGPHAVALGRWSPMTPGERIQAAREQIAEMQRLQGISEPSDDGWGRLIRPDEIDTVAGQIAQEKIREGWQPPIWHWRFYWERLLAVLNNVGLVNVVAYNSALFTPRRFFQSLREALKARYVAKEEPEQPYPLHNVAYWRDVDSDGFDI